MDKTRIVVYGSLLLFIILISFFWIFGKEFVVSSVTGSCSDSGRTCVHYDFICRCFGILKKGSYYWDKDSCVGLKIDCKNFEWEGGTIGGDYPEQ